jgi:putative transposase
MQRNIIFSEGEYYHIYNRGVEKRDIFIEQGDYERFMKLLFVANGTKAFEFREIKNKVISEIERNEPLTALGAYVLMPNHFHLLVKEISEGGISKFMEKLGTGYSSYFNRKYKRSGTLFEGTYKAKHADTDEYLKYLFAYIHLNPVKLMQSDWKEHGIRNATKSRKYIEEYRYSSYAEYIGKKREDELLLSRKEFPEYFEEVHEFKYFVNDWLEFSEEAQSGD